MKSPASTNANTALATEGRNEACSETLPTETTDIDDVRIALSACGVVDSNSKIAIRSIDRKMSNLWRVTVFDHGAPADFFVKKVGGNKLRQPIVTERQSAILKSVSQVCSNLNYFESVYVGYCADKGLIVLKRSDLSPLSVLISRFLPLQTVLGDPNVGQGVTLAAKWLWHWHNATRSFGDIAEKLDLYVQGRKQGLDLLPNAHRRTLLKAVQSCPDDELVSTHSDFTVFNVLTDGRRLSIIDPGIWEWSEMSPCWDICTFLASLEAQIRFSWKRSLTWRPHAFTQLQRMFIDVYGTKDITQSQTYFTCAAVRHFSLFAGEYAKHKKVANWHARKMQVMLESIEQLRIGERHKKLLDDIDK
jgi:hypothetical protein